LESEFTNTPYTWALLDRVANLFNVDDRIPVSAQTKMAQSSLPPIRFLILQTEIERTFRLGQLDYLPTLAERIELDFASGLKLMRQKAAGQQSPAPPPPDGWQRQSDMSGEKLPGPALVAACAHGIVEQVITAWRIDVVGQKWGDSFSTWLDHAQKLLSLSAAEAAAQIRDPEHLSGTDGQLLAARVASDAEAAPSDSLRSQVQLVLALAPGFWRPAAGHTLAQLSERAWRRHIEHPALLRSPHLSIPAITKACDSRLLGIAKAAAIILAASEAIGPRISPAMREQLLKLQDEDLPVVETESPFQPLSSAR